jgi:predicted ester cyclase
MTVVSNEILIDGPPNLVFDVVTTTRSWPFWHPATEAVSGQTDRPLSLGDQVRERAVLGGRVHEGTWSVTDSERPARLVLQIEGGRIQIVYTFAARDGGTLLRRELTYQPGDFAGGADPDTLATRMHAQSEEALHRLKPLVEFQMPLEQNKILSRRTLERAFNERDLTAVDEGFAADALMHDPGMDFVGPQDLKRGLATLFDAFPDFHFTLLDQLADGDLVSLRYRGHGTHQGEFLGMPATGRRIDYTGQIMLRMHDGQIVEFWANPDQLGLLKQLGATALPGALSEVAEGSH